MKTSKPDSSIIVMAYIFLAIMTALAGKVIEVNNFNMMLLWSLTIAIPFVSALWNYSTHGSFKRASVFHLALAYCFMSPLSIYSLWVTGYMEEIMQSLQYISTNAVTIITAISAFGTIVGFLVSSFGRYNKAQKYKIPFKLTYTNINEPISLMVELLALLVLGLAAPFIINFSLSGTNISYILSTSAIMAFFILVGLANTLKTFKLITRITAIRGKWLKIIILLVCAMLITVAFVSIVRLPPQNIFFCLSFVFVILYSLAILWASCKLVIDTIMGDETGTAPFVELDGQIYFVAMRHSDTQWICVPLSCEEKINFDNLPETEIKGDFVTSEFTIVEMNGKTVKNRVIVSE